MTPASPSSTPENSICREPRVQLAEKALAGSAQEAYKREDGNSTRASEARLRATNGSPGRSLFCWPPAAVSHFQSLVELGLQAFGGMALKTSSELQCNRINEPIPSSESFEISSQTPPPDVVLGHLLREMLDEWDFYSMVGTYTHSFGQMNDRTSQCPPKPDPRAL